MDSERLYRTDNGTDAQPVEEVIIMSTPTALEPELQESRQFYEELFDSPECSDTISVFFDRGSDKSLWVIDSFKTLLSYKKLPENWDSYGSPPPTEEAINSAQIILFLASSKGLNAPFMRPLSGGGIQISWKEKTRELDLAILKNGNVDFLKCEKDDVIGEEQAVPSDRLREPIYWVAGSAN